MEKPDGEGEQGRNEEKRHPLQYTMEEYRKKQEEKSIFEERKKDEESEKKEDVDGKEMEPEKKLQEERKNEEELKRAKKRWTVDTGTNLMRRISVNACPW